jgi:hypothetical protein
VPVFSATGSGKLGNCDPGHLGKKRDPISKICKVRRAEGRAEVVERLPSKWEDLNCQKIIYVYIKVKT